MIVVSDTSPICYLLLIGEIELLPRLYQIVFIPQAVANELSAPESPAIIQNWIAQPPDWLQIEAITVIQEMELGKLDLGEQAAILLAEQLNADLIVLDDKAARHLAVNRGLNVIGLLGILKDAARCNQLDLEVVFTKLKEVGFWVKPSLFKILLSEN